MHLDAWPSNVVSAAILVGGGHIWLYADPHELTTMSKRAFAARRRIARGRMARRHTLELAAEAYALADRLLPRID